MKLNRKILLITISILFISLLISSVALVYNFRKNYTEALLTGSYGLGQSLNSVVTELLNLGLPLDSFTGMDRKCRQLLENNPHIAYAGITDLSGKVLYNGDPALVGRVFSDEVMHGSLASTKPITQIYHRFDGHDYYDVTIPIFDSAHTRLGQIRLGFRTSVVNDKLLSALLQVIVNFSLSFVVIAVLINFFMSRFVSRPVIRISEHARKIADGDYDEELPVTSDDEVGLLAGSVNQMSSQVKQKTRDLEAANTELQLKLVERQKAEASLRASEEKFRTFVENSFDVIFVLDPAGVFRFVSPSWGKHFGFPASEVIGHDFRPFVHPDDAAPCVEYLMGVMSTGQGATSPHYRVRHADGSWRLFIANGTCYTDTNGVRMYVGTGRDISDQKRAEEERLNLERNLLHTQKLESLGVLAGGIAHDFNNLLAAILGNLDLTLFRLDPASPGIPGIKKAIQACRRASDLTQQMLAYSGKGVFQLREIDLDRLVEENIELLRTTVPKTITLKTGTTNDLPLVNADPGQIQQVVMNLITNASEAIGETPGTIVVTTGVQECDEALLKRSRLPDKPPPGRYAYIEVSDSGCGMDQEAQNRIFEPFYTTKFTGRGLGMSAVLGIIKAHNGAILMYSEQGTGTTFKVFLPVSKGPRVARREEPAPPELPEARSGYTGTVLIVDDEPSVREICVDYVGNFGFDTLNASDGVEAVEVFRRHADDIALVILDLTMPRMDGVAAFRELKRIRPFVKVIASSGHAPQTTAQSFPDQKPDAFLQKPFDMQTLELKIRETLAGAGPGRD